MKATINSTTIAEAPQEELISIEGNWYFPPSSLKSDVVQKSSLQTQCFWKGQASYYDITVNGETSKDAAWYYPQPMDGASQKVGKDFTNYVAFSPSVTVSE